MTLFPAECNCQPACVPPCPFRVPYGTAAVPPAITDAEKAIAGITVTAAFEAAIYDWMHNAFQRIIFFRFIGCAIRFPWVIPVALPDYCLTHPNFWAIIQNIPFPSQIRVL
jgi:hypothetical protein